MWRSRFVMSLLPVVAALHLPIAQRRGFIIGAVAAASDTIIRPTAASADDVSKLLYGGGSKPDASVFVGEYTDPMHPGGTRQITLLSTQMGPYQLARVVGGGGEGEPLSYELPAMVAPAPGKANQWQITIDFSPKGGPKDFTGYWDGTGIRFPPTPRQIERGNAAGNFWPQVTR